jgi:di/tricarboxylate transporter
MNPTTGVRLSRAPAVDGHQCNTLVMGPGGYRFGDYSRLGAPLSLIVVLVGVPLILFVWPIAKL